VLAAANPTSSRGGGTGGLTPPARPPVTLRDHVLGLPALVLKPPKGAARPPHCPARPVGFPGRVGISRVKGATTSHPAKGKLGLWAALVLALQGVLYTYDGWTVPVYFGEEVRDPARNIPRSMFGGVLLTIGIYLLVNLALLYVLPVSQIAGDRLAVGAAAREIFGASGGTVISALATLSMLSTVNSCTLVTPRILFAMSRDGVFPRQAAEANEGGTPTVALLLSTAVAVFFILSGTLEMVLAVLVFFNVTNYAVTFVSVFVLRWHEPDAVRPYRTWGYPWSTAVVLTGSLAFLAGAVAGDTRNSIRALFFWRRATLPSF
jgi:APA family basic amino acid/polyamine antiporter